MAYIECFVAPVPNRNREEYLTHATMAAGLFKKHGAVRVMENWGSDVPDGEVTSFPLAVQAKKDETVVMGWVEWPSKEARDEGAAKAFAEMEQTMAGPMPFDGKRLIFAGFENMLTV